MCSLFDRFEGGEAIEKSNVSMLAYKDLYDALASGDLVLARAFAARMGVPLALLRIIGPGRALLGVVLAAAVAGGFLIVRLEGRAEGWRIALVAFTVAVLLAVSVR